MNEQIDMSPKSVVGVLQIILRDKFGNIKYDKTVPNLVVNTGKSFIASRMVGTSSAVISHMGIGSSNTTAQLAQITLLSEVARSALTSSTQNSNVLLFSATFPAGSPAVETTIREAALFNAGTGGTMICRSTFADVNKGVSDILDINWQITIN